MMPRSIFQVLFVSVFLLSISSFAQTVENFVLYDVTSEDGFELNNHSDAKGIILIFTSLNCPFSKLYEERIMDLNKRFSKEGFVFALINPHLEIDIDESKDEMRKRVIDKSYELPFLVDSEQIITQKLQVTKLPEVVIVTSHPTGFNIVYRGAIDNNPQVASGVSIKYLENALNSLSQKRNPSPSSTRAVGCNIKKNP